MKKLILFLLILVPAAVFAQDQAYGNLTVFSEKGEQFFLYLNGEKKNDKPMSKVRVEQLTGLSYNVKIEYSDASHFTITKNNVFISDGDDNLMDAAYRIVRNGSSGKLKFYSMNPVKKGVVPFTPGDGNTSSTQNSEYATGALNVFSEQGEPFYLYLNGEKQNEKPYANVRVEGLTGLSYNVKIVYSDSKLNPVTRNKVYISDGDDMLMDATYRISRTSWYGKLKFYSMNPLNPAFVAPAGMFVHHYGNSAADYAAGSVKENSKNTKTENNNAIVAKPVTVNEPSKKEATQKKTPEIKKEPVVSKPAPATAKTAKVEEKKEPAPKEPVNNTVTVKEPEGWLCQNEWPMWKTEYAEAKKNIIASQNDKQKLAAAMKLAGKNCLSTDQVAEIGALLTEESSRLEFAKFAFTHTIDVKNYLKITRIFTSEKSKQLFTKYVATP